MNSRSCLALAIGFPMLLSSIPLALAAETTSETLDRIQMELKLSDITDNKNEDAIIYLYKHSIIGGYPDGMFRPLNTVNRAELLKILVGGKGAAPTADTYNNCFPDVTNEWFAPFVCYAKEQGWVGGYPDGTFRPANTVNTAEALKMVVNAQGYQVPESVAASLYSDVDSGAWFAPYVKAAKDKGILEPVSGNLGAASDMKRGGISEIIYRALYISENALPKFEAKARDTSSFEYNIKRISIYPMLSNWDSDAEEDGIEIKPLFYFISKTKPSEGEISGSPTNSDWTAKVSIYAIEEDDNYVDHKGKIIYEHVFAKGEVEYDADGFPFVHVPESDIKDVGDTHGWVEVTFSSLRGDFSAKEERATVRKTANENIANQPKKLNLASMSFLRTWQNWDGDVEKDGIQIDPFFKNTDGKQVYPNSTDWTAEVRVYDAELGGDFKIRKTILLHTIMFAKPEVKYEDPLGTPYIQVPIEKLSKLLEGDDWVAIEVDFSSAIYGKFSASFETTPSFRKPN